VTVAGFKTTKYIVEADYRRRPPSRKTTAESTEIDGCSLPSTCGTCAFLGAPFRPGAFECNNKVRTVQTPLPAFHRHAACSGPTLTVAQGLAQEAGATFRSCSRRKGGAYESQIYVRWLFPQCVHSDCWLVCRSCCDPPNQDLLLVNRAGSNSSTIWIQILNSSRSPSWAEGQLSLLAQASVSRPLREVLRNLT